MPDAKCSFSGCNWSTGEDDVAIVVERLKIHALEHAIPAQQQPAADTHRQKPPKLNRPSISKGISEEDWSTVSRKWDIFKSSTNIPQDQLSTQLWQCCDEELTSELFRDIPNISTIGEANLLASIKQLAVLSVATCVRKTELFSLRQERDQRIRSFAAKVKGKAHTCAFSKKCGTPTCTQNVDYTDDIVKHVLLAGIVDEDIKREVLDLQDLDSKSLNDTISLIESKEMAARAMSAQFSGSGQNNIAAAHNKGSSTANNALRTKLAQKTNCKKCNVSMQKYKQFKPKSGPPKLREFDLCKECWDTEKQTASKDSSKPLSANAIFDQLSAVWIGGETPGDLEFAEDTSTNVLSTCDELLRESKSAIASVVQLLTSSTSAIASECEQLLDSSQLLMQKLSDQLMEIPGFVHSPALDQQCDPSITEPPAHASNGPSPPSAPAPSTDSVTEPPVNASDGPSPPSTPALPHEPAVAAITDVVLDHHIFDGTYQAGGGQNRKLSHPFSST